MRLCCVRDDCLLVYKGSFIQYVSKTDTYQGVRNVSFLENFGYALNDSQDKFVNRTETRINDNNGTCDNKE